MEKYTLNNVLLNEDGIDQLSRQLQDWLQTLKLERKNAIRLRLALEDLLGDLCAHYDRKATVSMEMVRQRGKTRLLIRYPGEAYHPGGDSQRDEWTNQFLTHLGLIPLWRYRHGENELSLQLPGSGIRSEVWLVLAFAAAVLMGLAGPLLPQAVTGFLSTHVFSSLSTVFMNLLGTFAGILIFLSVLSGICGIGNISDFNRMGKYLISRNVLLSFLQSAVCALLMIPFFSFRFGRTGGAGELGAVADMILAIIPADPVTPFQTGNTLQIVFMAVLIGTTMILLGSRTGQVRETLVQANLVVVRLVGGICRFLPVYIFASLTVMFWENGMAIFRTIWKPLVLCIAISFLLVGAALAANSLRYRVPVGKLLKKVLPGYLIGLTTASSTAAFGTILEENEHALGIDPQLSSFSTPLEVILNVGPLSGAYLAILYFLSEYNGVAVNTFWFVSSWLLVTIVAFAVPPVTGGALICLSVILAQFQVPQACLGMAGSLILLADFFTTAARIVMIQMELVREADHWKLLDVVKLRS